MASSFKLPQLTIRKSKRVNLPTFEWQQFEKEKKLGSGSFGSVYLGKYPGRDEKVVAKKTKCDSVDSKSRFIKEAGLLNATTGHRNIVSFFGFCEEPCSILMEYSCFDFSPFGVEKQVSTLGNFLCVVDDDFDFTSFADVLPVYAKDVTTGLEFLHTKNIVHRDLKPGNILVCNQHYSNPAIIKKDLETAYSDCPVVCKLADFGLSRSVDIQTKTILKSKTECIGRGTPAYMAPEVHLPKQSHASQDDLKKTDIWSLGLVMYAMVNPNVRGPYRDELEQAGLCICRHFYETHKLYVADFGSPR